jgi:hypothetical protein
VLAIYLDLPRDELQAISPAIDLIAPRVLQQCKSERRFRALTDEFHSKTDDVAATKPVERTLVTTRFPCVSLR